MLLSQILQSSFKALYRDQTIESSKLGTIHIFWREKENQISISSTIGEKGSKPIANEALRSGKCLWG